MVIVIETRCFVRIVLVLLLSSSCDGYYSYLYGNREGESIETTRFAPRHTWNSYCCSFWFESWMRLLILFQMFDYFAEFNNVFVVHFREHIQLKISRNTLKKYRWFAAVATVSDSAATFIWSNQTCFGSAGTFSGSTSPFFVLETTFSSSATTFLIVGGEFFWLIGNFSSRSSATTFHGSRWLLLDQRLHFPAWRQPFGDLKFNPGWPMVFEIPTLDCRRLK